jgi:hypothetical protein
VPTVLGVFAWSQWPLSSTQPAVAPVVTPPQPDVPRGEPSLAPVIAAPKPSLAPVVTAPKPAPAPSQPLRTKPSATPNARGYLNVFAEPWAHVMVDGKRVGTTPLRKLPLTVGEHRLRLVNPSGPTAERWIRIQPGQTELVDIELTR